MARMNLEKPCSFLAGDDLNIADALRSTLLLSLLWRSDIMSDPVALVLRDALLSPRLWFAMAELLDEADLERGVAQGVDLEELPGTSIGCMAASPSSTVVMARRCSEAPRTQSWNSSK